MVWHHRAELKLALAKTRGNTLKGYSDGSLVHDAGAYGWILGYNTIEGKFSEVARGWGVELDKYNPTKSTSTARMEALGLLRMAEASRKAKWTKGVTAQLDNETPNAQKKTKTQRTPIGP